jgi:hypothetical protein
MSQPTTRGRGIPPLSLGRPRWENLLLVISLAAFWTGLILKLLS